MIQLTEIAEAGVLNKPHGISGEISATLDIDIDIHDVKCLIIPVEGIFVPFFIRSVRPKGADSYLVTIDGIDSELKAKKLTNKKFYILRSDLPDDSEDDGGLYASDLIGYKVTDRNKGFLGQIISVNDATANVLFEIKSEDGSMILLPVADEFILDIDTQNLVLETDIPEELINLND